MGRNKLWESISLNKRNLSLFLLSFCPTVCFAAAGIADRWNNFLFWMKPALVFCLSSGFISFSLLLITFFIFRKQMTAFADRSVLYLREHNMACVLIIGILWTVFLNFIVLGLKLTLWIVAFLPVLALLLAFPIFLATRLRNKYLVGKIRILLLTAFFISSAVSILAFVYEVKLGMIKEPMMLTTTGRRIGEDIMQYPQDCLKYMCEGLSFFGAEVILSFILILLGNIFRKLRKFILIRKLSATHSNIEFSD